MLRVLTRALRRSKVGQILGVMVVVNVGGTATIYTYTKYAVCE